MERHSSTSPRKRKRASSQLVGQTGSGSYTLALNAPEHPDYVTEFGVKLLDHLDGFRHHDTEEFISRYFNVLPPDLPKRPAPPIALGDIRVKLNQGHYINILALREDLHLGFNRTLLFYKRDKLHSENAKLLQDEVERFYTEDIPWYDDWLYPSSDDTEACAKAAKRRPFPVKAFPSGPTRTRGSRGDVSVKLEDMPAGVPSLADAEEADDEQPAASTSASRKGKGRASVGRSGSRAGNIGSPSRIDSDSLVGSQAGPSRARRSLATTSTIDSSHSSPEMIPTQEGSDSEVGSPEDAPAESPDAAGAAPPSGVVEDDPIQQRLTEAQEAITAAQRLHDDERRSRARIPPIDRVLDLEKELEETKELMDSLAHDNGGLTRQLSASKAEIKELKAKLAISEEALRDERRDRKERAQAAKKSV